MLITSLQGQLTRVHCSTVYLKCYRTGSSHHVRLAEQLLQLSFKDKDRPERLSNLCKITQPLNGKAGLEPTPLIPCLVLSVKPGSSLVAFIQATNPGHVMVLSTCWPSPPSGWFADEPVAKMSSGMRDDKRSGVGYQVGLEGIGRIKG